MIERETYMIDCPECHGAGKVTTTYREAAPKKSVAQKKGISIGTLVFMDGPDKPKAWVGKVAKWSRKWWPFFACFSVILLVAYGFDKTIDHVIDSSNVAAAIKAKQDYLIVQYNDANEVQRCFLSPSKDGDVTVVGKGVIVWVPDVDNPGDIPAHVGLSDLSKCLRYK